jgi:hypothetical protein
METVMGNKQTYGSSSSSKPRARKYQKFVVQSWDCLPIPLFSTIIPLLSKKAPTNLLSKIDEILEE